MKPQNAEFLLNPEYHRNHYSPVKEELQKLAPSISSSLFSAR
jgi:hypothetical protein